MSPSAPLEDRDQPSRWPIRVTLKRVIATSATPKTSILEFNSMSEPPSALRSAR